MSINDTSRCYPDDKYLKEMAAGVISKRFGSVDEAAKAVLNEEAGSNVDRLRRKFREQDWFARGLAEYVEAEIASRGLIKEPGPLRLFRSLRGTLAFPGRLKRKTWLSGMAVMKESRPKTPTAAVTFAAAGLIGLMASGVVTATTALMLALSSALFTAVFWADRASEFADRRQARSHLTAMTLATAAAVVSFGYASPDAAYTLGSFAGSVAAAFGLTSLGVYVTSYISVEAHRAGRRKTFEVSALIVALSILSQSGTALLAYDAHAADTLAVSVDYTSR
jgi:hypothetical protein